MPFSRRTFIKGGLGIAVAGGLGLAHGAETQGDRQVSEQSVVIQRTIPVRHEVDVFVAGGGPAGVAAAVGAARQGRSVFLAERQNCLGGMGTAGLLPVFMQFSDGENFLAGGVGREVLTNLQEAGGTGPAGGATIRAEVLKRVYDDMLLKAGVDFTFETTLVDIEAAEGTVSLAVLAAKSGLFAVRAKHYVDCTGDGDLAAWAGAPFEKGDEEGNMMAGTLCSVWADVDWERARAYGMQNQQTRLDDAFKDKVFTVEDRHLPGMWRIGERLAGGNLGHTYGVDGTDERSVTEAVIWARKLILEYERYYKEYLEGFEDMTLVTLGAMHGIRETRRILGDYVLNLEDFNQRATFDDEIGRYSYPVDIHAGKSGNTAYEVFAKEHKELRYGKGENYGIPYRSILARGLSNVLVAGRCISTDRYMQSSVRVMPGCFITGQAAGVAAALAAEKGTDTRGVAVDELQGRLKELGAFLPNC
ncbi:MAG: FAD-dependent oxidoreductase [Candidatus Hydrogenedentes bacterium]|nr:FAD-dependent oxidoreductase [Candidatus Hydrogenedentota bacterium]